MSQPFGGRADFQAYAAWQGMPTQQPLTTYPAGTTYIYTAYLPNFSSLSFIAMASGIACNVTFEFYASQSSGSLVSGHTAVIPVNGALNLTVPIQAPYVKIKFTVAPATTATMTWSVTPSNVPVVRPTHATTQQELFAVNLVVPAGGNTTLVPAYTVPGNGVAWFLPFDTSGKLDFSLQIYDSTGVFVREMTYDAGPTAALRYNFISPVAPVYARVFNNDAVNPHGCNFDVVFQGG